MRLLLFDGLMTSYINVPEKPCLPTALRQDRCQRTLKVAPKNWPCSSPLLDYKVCCRQLNLWLRNHGLAAMSALCPVSSSVRVSDQPATAASRSRRMGIYAPDCDHVSGAFCIPSILASNFPKV